MLSILRRIGGARRLAVSESAEVIRAEIFSAERLEQHAESLAIAQGGALTPPQTGWSTILPRRRGADPPDRRRFAARLLSAAAQAH